MCIYCVLRQWIITDLSYFVEASRLKRVQNLRFLDTVNSLRMVAVVRQKLYRDTLNLYNERELKLSSSLHVQL